MHIYTYVHPCTIRKQKAYSCLHVSMYTNIYAVMQISTQRKTHTVLVPSPCHHKYVPWIGGDLKPDTREYSKLCVYEASFPPLLKHLLNCHSHLSNCIISFIFLLLCPEYESIMSCGCPPKLSLAP